MSAAFGVGGCGGGGGEEGWFNELGQVHRGGSWRRAAALWTTGGLVCPFGFGPLGMPLRLSLFLSSPP